MFLSENSFLNLKGILLFTTMLITVFLINVTVYANNPVDFNGNPLKYNTSYNISSTSGQSPLTPVRYELWRNWDYIRQQSNQPPITVQFLRPSGLQIMDSEVEYGDEVIIKFDTANHVGYEYWSRVNLSGALFLGNRDRADRFTISRVPGINRNYIKIGNNYAYANNNGWFYAHNNSDGFQFVFNPVR